MTGTEINQMEKMRGQAARIVLILDGLLTIIAASFIIRVLPFRWTMALAGYRGSPVEQRDHSRAMAARCAAIATAWAVRMPWRAKCFETGLAAQWLLRRRGIASVLHYGVCNTDGVLAAHVWVSVAADVIVGAGTAQRYQPMLIRPDDRNP